MTEMVERLAAILLSRVNAPEQEIYAVVRDQLRQENETVDESS